jgi:hypothetical protein
MIHDQPLNVTAAGGILIKMDSQIPNVPVVPSETQQWAMAVMAGFFTFLACFGCLLMCVQVGLLAPDGGHVAFGRLPTYSPTIPLLSEAQVSALPQQEYKCNIEAGNQTACAICIEEYEEGEQLRQLPCDHCFHHDCIMPWLTERSPSCPLCKSEVLVEDEASLQTPVLERNPWRWRQSYGVLSNMLATPWVLDDPLLQTDDSSDDDDLSDDNDDENPGAPVEQLQPIVASSPSQSEQSP